MCLGTADVKYQTSGPKTTMMVLQFSGERSRVETMYAEPGPRGLIPTYTEDPEFSQIATFTDRDREHPAIYLGAEWTGIGWEPAPNTVIQIEATMVGAGIEVKDPKLVKASMGVLPSDLIPARSVSVEVHGERGLKIIAVADRVVAEGARAGVYLYVDPKPGGIDWRGDAMFRWSWRVTAETLKEESKQASILTVGRAREPIFSLSESWENSVSSDEDLGGWRVLSTNELCYHSL